MLSDRFSAKTISREENISKKIMYVVVEDELPEFADVLVVTLRRLLRLLPFINNHVIAWFQRSPSLSEHRT